MFEHGHRFAQRLEAILAKHCSTKKDTSTSIKTNNVLFSGSQLCRQSVTLHYWSMRVSNVKKAIIFPVPTESVISSKTKREIS